MTRATAAAIWIAVACCLASNATGSTTGEKGPAQAEALRIQDDRRIDRERDARDTRLTELDLAAQQGAAEAAMMSARANWWHVLISGVGILVTTIGTIYIVRTFRATKVAAEAALESVGEARRAADASQMATRPWIKVSVSNPVISDLGDQINVVLRVAYENQGQTPALRTIHTMTLCAEDNINFGAADELARVKLSGMRAEMAARSGADRTQALFPKHSISSGYGGQIYKKDFEEAAKRRPTRGGAYLIGCALVEYEYQDEKVEAIHQFVLTRSDGHPIKFDDYLGGGIKVYGGQDIAA